MQDKKPDINEILNKAVDDTKNELTRVFEDIPAEKSAGQDPETEGTISENKPAASNVPKRETDEIIGKYSQKKKIDTDPRSSTAGLRESLDKHMQGDKELLKYYREGGMKLNSKKVDELYSIINSATLSDLEVRKTIGDAEAVEGHFTDPGKTAKKPEYKQQKIYEFDDTLKLDLESQNGISAEYDEDYENLSEKIEKGEIVFEDDSDDDSQMSIINDSPAPMSDIMDKQDLNLRLAFDMMDETADIPEELKDIYQDIKELEKKPKQKKNEPEEKQSYEYAKREQNGEISEILLRASKKSLSRLILVFLLFLGLLYIELATMDSSYHTVYLRPGEYGLLYILVDLQLLFIIAFVMFDSVKRGFEGIFKGKPTADSILSCLIFISTLHCILTIIFDSSASAAGLYSLPAGFAALCCAVVRFLQCRKDYHCFKIIASNRPKYAACKLENNAREADEFYKYLLDDSELYTVKKTGFVDGFFKRTQKRPEGEDLFGFLIIIVLAAGLILAGLQIYMGSEIYEALTSFIKVAVFSLPVSSFFIISLPVIAANKVGRKCGSAFIGNAVGEEYADASVISFADTEVYPDHLVKIKSIKVYGDNRIDRIAMDLARVFAFIGGPLKTVTANMIPGTDLGIENARLIESAADGICVVLDGHEMFLGKKSYLRRYKFATPHDEGDEAFESFDGSIMYVTLDDELIAKIYVRYTINKQFNQLLKDMYKAGMCVGIKTLDPNINTELLERSVKFKKCPISILKAGDVSDVEGDTDRIDSGIVTNSSLHTFLKMFIVCDKVRHVTKSNGIISILSIILSFFVVFFLVLTDQAAMASSLYAILFQLLWLVPIRIISYLL